MDLSAVFSNRQSNSKGRFVYIIHPCYSAENPRIAKTSMPNWAWSLVKNNFDTRLTRLVLYSQYTDFDTIRKPTVVTNNFL